MTVSVDVLIPAYNAAETIHSAIESIQRQTLFDIRIHVVDDGSTDGTAACLANMASTDARIVIHTKANGGIVDALNHGLEYCTAEFVARHDADDLADPTRLAVQCAYLKLHTDIVAVGAAVRHIGPGGESLGTVGRLPPPELADPWALPAREPYLIHPFLTVRREALSAIGGYRHVHHAEDSDLYWRLRDLGCLHNLHEILGSYRIHPASISGASILNGRVQAISSQLAAVSARRRSANLPDLKFGMASLENLATAQDIVCMVNTAAEQLDNEERRWFEIAVAAKLLELAAYRPYEIEPADCDFIGRAVRHPFDARTIGSRKNLRRQRTGTAARLARKGRLGDALKLLDISQYPAFAVRYLARSILPPSMIAALRGKGAAPVK
jgi:glycosyltransferase involved in cell wall biosynthesis